MASRELKSKLIREEVTLHSHHYFYEQPIARKAQEELVNEVLGKYAGQEASDELRAQVYDDLMLLKYENKLLMPFKVILKKDEGGNYPPHIEVLLDTRV